MTEQTLEIEKQDKENTKAIERVQPQRRFIPRVDVFENEEAVFVTVDMPGVSEQAVDLTLEKNILTITGQIDDVLPESFDISYREYRSGDYRRSFALSDEIDRENIEAVMKNGVLRLTLNKVEEAKARKIEVRAE